MIFNDSNNKLINSIQYSNNMEENLIPMINIIFLLLIFFMVAGQIRYQSDKDIKTPFSSSEQKLNPTDIEILIDRNMNIEYDGEEVLLTEVSSIINSIPDEINVILRADKNIKASQLDDLLNVFRKTRISTVKLISSTS